MAIYTTKKVKIKIGQICTLRSGVPDDAPRALSFMNLIFEDGEGMVLEPGELVMTLEEERTHIQKFLDAPNEVFLVAEVENEIVGILDVHASKRRRLAHTVTFGISLHPEWRSRGIGTALLQALFEWVETRKDIEKISLKVLNTNVRAIGLYKKFGFVEDGRSISSVKVAPGVYLDDVSMSCFVNGLAK